MLLCKTLFLKLNWWLDTNKSLSFPRCQSFPQTVRTFPLQQFWDGRGSHEIQPVNCSSKISREALNFSGGGPRLCLWCGVLVFLCFCWDWRSMASCWCWRVWMETRWGFHTDCRSTGPKSSDLLINPFQIKRNALVGRTCHKCGTYSVQLKDWR